MTSPTASSIVSTASDRPSAAIIAFPARPGRAESGRPESGRALPGSGDRLAKALESLNAALADQREAVAAWRAVLGELKATTSGLHESLRGYRANLGTLGTSVSALHAKAKSLERWADGVLAD